VFRVGCSAAERLVFPPLPKDLRAGTSVLACRVGSGAPPGENGPRASAFVVPFLLTGSGFRALSQPSSVWMLFWSLLNVDVKQFVCPLLRKNSLLKKQSCSYEVAYLS